MNFTEQVNEQEKEITGLYEKAQKAFSALRLKATLYDTAQAILNLVRPGETVTEIVISTNTAKPLADVLAEAEAVVENSKKQPAKKTVYVVMYAAVELGVAFFKTWPSAEIKPNEFSTLEEAAKVAREKQTKNSVWGDNDFYFVSAKEIDA